jgi:hypothetical protein
VERSSPLLLPQLEGGRFHPMTEPLMGLVLASGTPLARPMREEPWVTQGGLVMWHEMEELKSPEHHSSWGRLPEQEGVAPRGRILWVAPIGQRRDKGGAPAGCSSWVFGPFTLQSGACRIRFGNSVHVWTYLHLCPRVDEQYGAGQQKQQNTADRHTTKQTHNKHTI